MFTNLRKIMILLALVMLLGVVVGSAWAQEPEAPPDAATAVSGGDVQSVTESPDGGQVVVIDTAQDESWLDTVGVGVFGALVVAAAIILYLLKQNADLAGQLRDYLPSEAWQSIYDGGVKTAMSYAQRTPTALDDDLVKVLAKQVAAALNVKNE